MAHEVPPNNLMFRNSLRKTNYSAKKYLELTPDIIPHYGNKLDPNFLIQEYDNLINLPLQPNEINNIYFRAKSDPNVEPGARTAVVLRAVPNELILWPQVWNKTNLISPGPLVVTSSAPNEIIACATPFRFTPPNMGGTTYALIATQYPLNTPLPPETRLRDALPPPAADVKNWKDLVNYFNNDTSTVYYNFVVEDSKAPIISASTRLRIFDDGTEPLPIIITILCSAFPEGTYVSLSSTTGVINMAKCRLPGPLIYFEVPLSAGFDDILTINIFLAPDGLCDPLSFVSLRASVNIGGNDGSLHDEILGSLNIVIHDEATTHLNYASHAANRLQEYINTKDAEAKAGAIPTTSDTMILGRATGWWFRDHLFDVNKFPRQLYGSNSPDIQPVGTQNKPEFKTILGGYNSNLDWSNEHQINLQQGAPNYIYLRGNCTLGDDYLVETRLFCVPDRLLLYPPMYSLYAVTDGDDQDGRKTAIRRIISTSASSFNVLDRPFDLLNPAPPQSGSHYSFIAESRHPTDENPDPNWPHEDTDLFISGAKFAEWIANTPNICWRCIGYYHGGATIICTTTIEIPRNIYPPSTLWYVIAEAFNAPVGSSWELTSDISIEGAKILFPRTLIASGDRETRGCGFTGIPPGGIKFRVNLQWFSEGKNVPNDMRFGIQLVRHKRNGGPNMIHPAATITLPEEAANWPFSVGIHHPGLENKINAEISENHIEYLGDHFKTIGPNPWPHKTPVTGFVMGSDTWLHD
ncbi:hypothetical protein JR316_0000066 [Psilocybe cubensis]|uniref:Uncharacterized protein n=2 Tax=Psilocybe cubensis TaxID=181762 RepID=A0A8H8CQ03_PSICU|nr:hypothetical protein JR316_0000066 [Psilocybe cubensis]KAH9486003.1 hypothetical protein JR316_0000066 [Psilocybe cubensis]